MRNAYQFRVGELDSGAQIAVVEQDLDTALAQIVVEFNRGISDTL